MAESPRPKVIVCGILFWYPLAGVTYQFLHYLLGLRQLGYDPYYIEDSARWPYNLAVGDCTPDARPNIELISPVLERFGFSGRWAFRGRYEGGSCFGLRPAELDEVYRQADVILNVTGAQEFYDDHLQCPCRVYVETDPVEAQIGVHQGKASIIHTLDQHTHHFTYGENLGHPDCGLPADRYIWRPTRQPVLLDLWPPLPPSEHSRYNTIATWKNKGKDIEFNCDIYYWSKDREFVKFIDLPRRRKVSFELATNPDPQSAARLVAHGWQLTDPVHISSDMYRYHQYICLSRGEFTVAKDQNIRLRSGWFSDRSACYLAAGRPVINQDTAFGVSLPTGRGLFAFSTMDDILSAIDAIESDYPSHCIAARQIAEEYFAAHKVLKPMMDEIGC
jgi:hypothetical protein